MFSNRLDINIEPNELSLLYREKMKNGEEILDLTLSNPTKLGFRYDAKRITKEFIDERSLVYEPEPKGMLLAREEVSRYYSEKRKVVDPDDIFIVPSTSEAYSYLFKLLLEPGDEVLIPQPCYPLFEFLVKLDSGNVVFYPMEYDFRGGWLTDFNEIEKRISGKTKVIVIINPNNPTGTYLKKNEFGKFDEISSKHGLAMIIDEVFSDYAIEENQDSLLTAAGLCSSLCFILNGFSKMLGLPQMKFGWIAVQGESMLKKEAIKRLEIIADTYLSVATPVQHAAKVLFETREKIQDEIKERIRRNYELLRSGLLLNPDIKSMKSEGGWSAIINFENLLIKDDDFALRLLEKKNVLVHPGYYYDFPDDWYAVLSLLTKPKAFEEGVRRIAENL